MHGTNAASLIIKVPVGTAAYIIDSGREMLVADMATDGQMYLLAKGGRGGKGNVHFATSTRKAPRMFQKGEEGQQLNIMLRMRLVVDVCIVGFTNSGKSTLLSALSSARPEIADYRFTTKMPVLGVVDDGENTLTWVELPALTKDSRLGKGLGNTFLNQAVRASVIVYLLDAGSSNLKGDFDILRDEISAFDEKLGQKASTIVINKMDSANMLSLKDYVNKKLEVTGLPCIMISALDNTGLDTLVTRVHQAVKETRSSPSGEPAAEVVFRPEPVDRRDRK